MLLSSKRKVKFDMRKVCDGLVSHTFLLHREKKGMQIMKKKGFFRLFWQYRLLLLMILPAMVYFIIFSYIPMAGSVLAFKKYDFSLGMFKSPWAGLDNFEFLFNSGKLGTLLLNTVLYNVAFILVGRFCEVLIAVILSEIGGRFFKKICQTFVFLPYFVSMVVVGAISYNLLNYRYGFINNIISGLGAEKINFYSNAAWWPFILVLLNTWKGIGYGSVVYLAAITGIDAEIHEAAKIDGANILQRVRYITLPCLVPTIITLTLMSIGSIFRGNFDLFWNTVGENSVLYSTTDVIDTYVYRGLLNSTNYGMTAATGLLQSILCFFTLVIVNAVVKKIDSDSALF